MLDVRNLNLANGFADTLAGGANAILTFTGVSGQIGLLAIDAADIDQTDFLF